MATEMSTVAERREFGVTLDEEGFADLIGDGENAGGECEILGEYPRASVGWKRFRLGKGRRRVMRVNVGVELRHVLTIMGYLPKFKLRVPWRNLDMKLQSDLKIILDTARNNGLFIYVIDRFVTLCTILILTVGDQGDATLGPSKMVLFLLLKLLILVYEVRLNIQDMESSRGTTTNTKVHVVGKSLLTGDSFVWLMQTMTLLVLLLGHSQVEKIPSPIASILGIFITALTMLTMNWRSFREMLADYSVVVVDRARSLRKRLAFYAHCLRELISRWRSVEKERSDADDSMHHHHAQYVEGIDFVTPEFGLVMGGRVEVEELVREEGAGDCIEKRVFYHSVSRKDFPHYSLESPRDLARYEGDIKSRLAVVIGTRQLRCEEAIGDLAVTLQVVNHAENPSLCAAEMDSYFSLYYPAGWGSGLERRTREINVLARQWLYEVVGLVESCYFIE